MTRHIMTVEVRGRVFPSSQACADHFGILRSTVYYAIDKGTTENLGQDGVKGRSQKLTYRGFSWPSSRAASVALGLNSQYVAAAISGTPRQREILEGYLAVYHKKLQGPVKP
jgi:hypothetical protein